MYLGGIPNGRADGEHDVAAGKDEHGNSHEHCQTHPDPAKDHYPIPRLEVQEDIVLRYDNFGVKTVNGIVQ